MDKIIINGKKKLNGEVNISSAKNSILPIIAGSILCSGKCVLMNSPMLEDVFVISSLLESIGSKIVIDKKKKVLEIDNSLIKNNEPPRDLCRKMRASFLIMGPMLARFGKFKIAQPGGCNIGTRPIELHLKGFLALGAKVNSAHGSVEAFAKKLIGNNIYLDFPSVGATENIMMAAVFADGQTVIENAAAEPEIEDLANFLNKAGARISGAGTNMIKIEGVKELSEVTYTPIYDRIEAGTFMAAAAITRSKIKINGVNEEYLKPIVAKMTELGAEFEIEGSSIIIDADKDLKPIDIKTMPYPGFPTDMQAQMMAVLCTIKGTSIITETVFENRFLHVPELKRMGANIKIDGRSAVIEGVKKLMGCEVKATDLRAGAAMILGGLAAEGYTTVGDVYHIDRGYVDIEGKLKKLGADIKRIKE